MSDVGAGRPWDQTAKKSNQQFLDRAVACSFFEIAIPSNVGSSSSFADMIGESMSFSQHNYLELYKLLGSKTLVIARKFQAARNNNLKAIGSKKL